MKKILFIVPTLTNGGAERVVSIWISELEKIGKNVHLLVFYREKNEYPIDKNIKIDSIAKNKEEYEQLSIINSIQIIRKIIKKNKIDIIIPFLYFVGIMTNIARIGLNVKLIETIRADPRYSPTNKIKRIIRNISILFSDTVIVQNKEQKEYFPVFLQNKIEIFSNPVSNDFLETQRVNKSNAIKTIVSVGRLVPQKNHGMLIDAFSKLNDDDLTLLIYGEGELEVELQKKITNMDLDDKIKLCGRTDYVLDKLKKSDLYILTSNFEGMPNSLMEAMAIGLPTISTDCPTGPSDLIRSGENGILIPVGDVDSLTNAINYLVSSPNAAMELGEKAKEDIKANFSAASSAQKLYKYLVNI